MTRNDLHLHDEELIEPEIPLREALGTLFPADQGDSLWCTYWWLCLLAPSSGEPFPLPVEDRAVSRSRRLSPQTLRRHIGRLAKLGLLVVDWRANTISFHAGPLDPLPGEGVEIEPPPAEAWTWTFKRSIDPEFSEWVGFASGPARWRRPVVVLKRQGVGWAAGEGGLVAAPLEGWTHHGPTRAAAANEAAPPWRIPDHYPDNMDCTSMSEITP